MFGVSSIAAYLMLSEDGILLPFVFVLALTNFNLSFYYEIRKENSRYSYIYLIERIVYVSGAFVLIGFDFLRLEYIFMLYAAATILSLSFQFLDSRALTSLRVQGLARRTILLIPQNLPLVITGLALFTFGGISRLVLEDKLGPEALGIYSAGWQLITIASIYQAQVVRVWRLKLSNAIHRRNFIEFVGAVKTYLIFGVIPMCFAGGFLGLSAEWIVPLLFTEEYAALAPLLPIFGLLFVVISMMGLVEICWIATGKTIIYMVMAVFYGLLLLIVLKFFSDGFGMLEFVKVTTFFNFALVITLSVVWYVRFYPLLSRKT
jgi:O-antigen/teichoic acid export membrane protein